jgi:MFS family permease
MERRATHVYYGWWLVVVLAIVTIVSYGTTQYLFGVLVVPVGHSLGTSRGQISSAYSIGLLVAGLLGIPVGRFVDRYGARRVLLAGSLLGAASLLGLSRAESLLEFWVLWSGGMGLAMGLTLYPVTFVVVANWFERRRGSAMALLTTLGGLSSPIFIPLAGWLVVSTGWRTALLLLSLTQLAMLPLEAILVRRRCPLPCQALRPAKRCGNPRSGP